MVIEKINANYSYRATNYLRLKKDIIDYKELNSYELFLIKQLTKEEQIEIIMLYDEMLGGLYNLIDCERLDNVKKKYVQINMRQNERIELIEIYNETVIKLNEYLENNTK